MSLRITALIGICLLGLSLMSGWLVEAQVRTSEQPIVFQSEAEAQRFKSLIEELRCTVCQNQSLADSDAPLAQDLRQRVLQQMRKGQDNDQIKSFLTERYGEFVLYRPPMNAATALLWLGPPLLLLFALGLWWLSARRQPTGSAV